MTEFIRGNTIGFTWQPPNEASLTSVRIKLFTQGAETTVELSHSGFPSSEALEKAVTNWEFYLKNLKSVIEQGAELRGQIELKTTRTASTRRRPSD